MKLVSYRWLSKNVGWTPEFWKKQVSQGSLPVIRVDGKQDRVLCSDAEVWLEQHRNVKSFNPADKVNGLENG